jgi:hypothetical protein
MEDLENYLSHLSEVDAETAEQTQDKLLEELEIPSEWDVYETDVEMAQEGPKDWFLISFQHSSSPDHLAYIYLLEGSHALQVYLESSSGDRWSDTTHNPHAVTEILNEHA